MQYHKRSDAVKQKKPSSLGRFLPVMYQVLFFALFVAYLFGEYPAYLVTLCLFLFLWFMSNSCIHLEALKSLLPLNRPLIIASKCASKDAPENTLGAAKEAIKKGAKALHFQVRLTADKIPIVFGDDTLEERTNGSGRSSLTNYSFMSLLDASFKDENQNAFPKERIPKLDEMIDLCFSSRIIMVIEMFGKPVEVLSTLKSLYERNATLYKNIIVISKHPYLIYLLRRNIPNIMCGLVYRQNQLSLTTDGKVKTKMFYLDYLVYRLIDIIIDWSFKNWLWYVCGNSFIFAFRSQVSESMVEYYRKLGVVIVVWPVNSDVAKDYFTKILMCPIMTETLKKDVPIKKKEVTGRESMRVAEIQKLLLEDNLKQADIANEKLNIVPEQEEKKNL